MRLDQPISASEYQSDKSYDLVPPGWYSARITDATVKATKAGTGKYVAVRYDIIGPTHEGRVVYGNLNVSNPNPIAEKIGREQLSDLMRAIGLGTLADTDQLIGGTCQIKVAIEVGEGAYKDRNEVKAWKVADGAKVDGAKKAATPTAASPSAAPTEAAASRSLPPWRK
jgi:hypothetical protein